MDTSYHYHITDYNGSKILFREGLGSKHLLWEQPYNGSPAIRASVWDAHRDDQAIGYLGAKMTSGKKFIISRHLFNEHKKKLNYAGDAQYAVDKYWWTIIEPENKQPTLL